MTLLCFCLDDSILVKFFIDADMKLITVIDLNLIDSIVSLSWNSTDQSGSAICYLSRNIFQEGLLGLAITLLAITDKWARAMGKATEMGSNLCSCD
ncbi:armadillo/beta-catenin-like repeats-containing protein [Corchorus olitorius]|uniref:Armadillo/beta-catenin-like repeats-containing protein n=1 Tax=Corchorus olitorius TaxID=93759 RepID=A0A1R3GHI2_9ROSI|nr:armadillo/beta-catenin-like repeats-containing protein [Corchorus olitorius]